MREGMAGLDALLKQADVALYAAKRCGRDRVVRDDGGGAAPEHGIPPRLPSADSRS
jgi:hypothetical protein